MSHPLLRILSLFRFLRSERRVRRRVENHQPVHVQALEDRALLAVTGSYNPDTEIVTITGDEGDDEIYGIPAGTEVTGDISEIRINAGDGFNKIALFSSKISMVTGGSGLDELLGRAVEGSPRKVTVTEDVISVVNGTDAVNTVTYSGIDRLTIGGTDGGDTFDASAAASGLSVAFYGYEGMDTLIGGPGDDILEGGDDKDTIRGNAGDDTIRGGEGNDTLHGGDDDDFIRGEEGNDKVYGESGNDSVYGDQGADTVDGGSGNDIVVGNGSVETESGMQTLSGGSGFDRVFIEGQASNSTVSGGSDGDLLTWRGPNKTSVTALGSGAAGSFSIDGDTATGFEALKIDMTDPDRSDVAPTQNVTVSGLTGVVQLDIFTDTGGDVIEVHAPNYADGEGFVRIYSDEGKDTIELHAPDQAAGEGLEVSVETEDGDDDVTLFIAPDSVGPIEVDVRGGTGKDDLIIEGTNERDEIFVTQLRNIAPGEFSRDLESAADDMPGQDLREFSRMYIHANDSLINVNMEPQHEFTNEFGTFPREEQAFETLTINGQNGNDTIAARLDFFDNDKVLDEVTISGGDDSDDIDMSGVSKVALPSRQVIKGNAGADRLFGRDGEDDISGDDADDLVVGNGGDDLLDGGDDSDIILGDGLDLSIAQWETFGLIARSLLAGSPNTIALQLPVQGTGVDTIQGGPGDDFIIGGDAKDIIDSGDGRAIIFGDEITQAPQISTNGFWTNPKVAPEINSLASFLTGEGDDEITGSSVHGHIIVGGAGDDTFAGGNAPDDWDYLFGNGGTDTIDGKDGHNIIVGGTSTTAEAEPKETLTGGQNFDLIIGDDFTFGSPADFSLSGLLTGSPVLDVALWDGFEFSGTGNDIINTGAGVNVAFGGNGDDHITAGNGPLDALFGNAGEDTIEGGNGSNIIFGGDGDDPALNGGDDTDLILGDSLQFDAELSFDLSQILNGDVPVKFSAAIANAGTGNDTINAGAGTNFVWGGMGNDIISAGNGPLDILFGNDGRDTINGGNGTNVIVGGDGSDPDLKGGDDLDVILGDSFTFGDEDVAIPQADDANAITQFFRTGAVFRAFVLTDSGDDDIQAGDGVNLVLGGAGMDTIRGGDNSDIIYGHEGNDTIFGGGGSGIDLLFGGDGGDIVAGNRNTTSASDDGANIIFGDNAFLDVSFDPGFLVGEQSWPSLNAEVSLTGNGNDFLYGSNGFDFIVGGDGEDNMWGRDDFNIAFGDDFSPARGVFDFAQALLDPASLTTLPFKAAFNLAKGLVDDVYRFFFGSIGESTSNGDVYEGGSGTDIVFGGDGKDTLNGGAGFDILAGGFDDDVVDVLDVGPEEDFPQRTWDNFGFGGPGDDLILGGNGRDLLGSTIGNDTIRGGGGNDVIVGGEDNDELYGEDGDDHLFGDEGSDLLDGGPGNDVLNGGTGSNTFVSDAGDEVIDGNSGEMATVELTVSATSGSERAATQIILTATASESVDTDQTVSVVVGGAGITADDFALTSSVITIPAGQTTGSVTLTVQSDQNLEGEETATISLSGYSSGISAGSVTSATLTIADDARPSIQQAARYRAAEEQFSWETIGGAARYQVWLSRLSPQTNVVSIDDNVAANSWDPAQSLDAGIYRFWVRAFDSDDNAGAWSSGYTFEVQPTLISPLGATFDSQPVFTWDAVPNVDSYEIYLRNGSEIIRESRITGTSWQPASQLSGPVIRWWIRPDSSPGNRGWSEAGDVRIDGRSQILAATPAAEDGSEVVLQWASVTSATRYILHVERSASDQVVIREDELVGTSFQSPSLAAGDYRAWVKAIDSSNAFTSGRWSRPFEFSVAAYSQADIGGLEFPASLQQFGVELHAVGVRNPEMAEETGQGSPARDTSTVRDRAGKAAMPLTAENEMRQRLSSAADESAIARSTTAHIRDTFGQGRDRLGQLFSGTDVIDSVLRLSPDDRA